MQTTSCAVILLASLIAHSLGLEYNRQQKYNPNTDFLFHEGGVNPSSQKRDYVMKTPPSQGAYQNTGQGNYAAQFPALGPQSSTQTTIKPSSPANRVQSNSGKRDYVAPQYPTLKPPQGNNQQNTGKVKDLVNFYETNNNNKQPNPPQKSPSYSSILQGSGNNKPSSLPTTLNTKLPQPVTQPSTRGSTTITKPMSFSSVVAGPTQPVPLTTSKPTTKPTSGNNKSPGTTVLPSSILNNKNNQGPNSNSNSDIELQTLSEELLRKDTNNAAKYVTINYQEKTTSQSKEDKAPLPLLSISPEVWNITTIQRFLPLIDNYERDTLVNEYVTPQERNEENAFMDAIMSTSVIRHLMSFLKEKGHVNPDPKQQRDFLKQLWFGLYSRGKGKISSSGFEHIFVSELKNGEVSGLHNWIYFAKEEAVNRINYLGYLKYVSLADKGTVMKLHFNQQGVDKPVDSMFIGTSPELEIALYTLCFVMRPDNDCNLKLGSKDVGIITHTFRYRSKNFIGSGYPQI